MVVALKNTDLFCKASIVFHIDFRIVLRLLIDEGLFVDSFHSIDFVSVDFLYQKHFAIIRSCDLLENIERSHRDYIFIWDFVFDTG
jgi:hypothetical protein